MCGYTAVFQVDCPKMGDKNQCKGGQESVQGGTRISARGDKNQCKGGQESVQEGTRIRGQESVHVCTFGGEDFELGSQYHFNQPERCCTHAPALSLSRPPGWCLSEQTVLVLRGSYL